MLAVLLGMVGLSFAGGPWASAASAAATFTVTVNGTGNGIVSGSGIDCNKGETGGHETCGTEGTSVELTATSEAGSVFAGWSVSATGFSFQSPNPCGNSPTCKVTSGSGTVSITAAFAIPLPAPDVTIQSPTDVGSHEATFRGTVNPNGNDARWHFEYRPVGVSAWTNVPVPDGDAGSGETAEDVDATAEALEPNTEYEVRLFAKNEQHEETSGVETFTTESVPPTVSEPSAIAGTTMASFRGLLDPHNSASTYRFEYGDQGPCDANPCAAVEGSVPGANSPLAVFARAEDLAPATAYHFRLVATNAEGETSETADQTLTTGSPGPSRAYELVSPVPTLGVDIFRSEQFAASEDGDRVFYKTAGGELPGNEGSHLFYTATRGSTGWTSEPADASPMGETWVLGGNGATVAVPREIESILMYTNGGIDPDDQNNPEGDNPKDPVQGQDLYLRRPTSAPPIWLARNEQIPPGTPQTEYSRDGFAGRPYSSTMSADGDTVVFQSLASLLARDTTPAGKSRLYKWQRGSLSLAGTLPDGELPLEGSTLGTSSEFASQAVSVDGSRVVFSARRPGSVSPSVKALYVSFDGSPTKEATSAAGCPACEVASNAPLAVSYAGASSDVSRVFFTSKTRLTANSGAANSTSGGADLYEFDADSGELRDLTPRLDGRDDPTVPPAPAAQARVQGVVRVANDGRRVYFVAQGVLPSGRNSLGEVPTEGANNLYVYSGDPSLQKGQVGFIATLGSEASEPAKVFESEREALWQIEASPKGAKRAAFTNQTGTVLAFQSAVPITGQPLGDSVQLFVYEAQSAALACASCPGNGATPGGSVNGGSPDSPSGNFILPDLTTDRHLVSEAGAVYFETPTALLPSDTNAVADVYEWDHGQLRLVSPGSGSTASQLFDASANGETVFFLTRSALAPQDDEPGVNKLYAARVGGGFRGPFPAPPECWGDGCQGTGPASSSLPAASSATFSGSGNATRKRFSCLRSTRKAEKLSNRAKRLRRNSVRVPEKSRALRMRRRARRLSQRAKGQRVKARRCRGVGKVAHPSGRATSRRVKTGHHRAKTRRPRNAKGRAGR